MSTDTPIDLRVLSRNARILLQWTIREECFGVAYRALGPAPAALLNLFRKSRRPVFSANPDEFRLLHSAVGDALNQLYGFPPYDVEWCQLEAELQGYLNALRWIGPPRTLVQEPT